MYLPEGLPEGSPGPLGRPGVTALIALIASPWWFSGPLGSPGVIVLIVLIVIPIFIFQYLILIGRHISTILHDSMMEAGADLRTAERLAQEPRDAIMTPQRAPDEASEHGEVDDDKLATEAMQLPSPAPPGTAENEKAMVTHTPGAVQVLQGLAKDCSIPEAVARLAQSDCLAAAYEPAALHHLNVIVKRRCIINAKRPTPRGSQSGMPSIKIANDCGIETSERTTNFSDPLLSQSFAELG